MTKNKLINAEIDEFYSQTSEETRLTTGLGPLEFERNKELLKRYLQSLESIIVDVGGGPGIYSEWLAGLGYEVHLVDPVQKHILQAQKKASKSKRPFNCIFGESRNLDFPDHFADLVILHGPLYHLQSRRDRLDSISEAKRILKPNGMILGFAINYSAYTLTGLLNGMIHEQGFYNMCKKHLLSGKHNAPSNLTGLLPQAYFHKPSELKNEFEEVGLKDIEILAVEGLIWLDQKYFQSRVDPMKKNILLDLLKITEKDESLLSLSPHMMISAKRA